jgi:ABC-type transporter Mla subunit MlaD
MASIEDLQAVVNEANESTNNIAADLDRVKQLLEDAQSGEAAARDQALSEALALVSPLGARLREVADSTPDPEPEPAPEG